jgi:hypothetical protein
MLELFSTNRLADEIGLRAALCHLDALGDHSGLQPAIEHLLSLPHVFAYIVSGISQTSFSFLWHQLTS